MFEKALKQIVRTLKEYHHQHGISLNHLADEADLCWGTVERLLTHETKQPRFSTIVKIARALGLEVVLKEVKAAQAKARKGKAA
jgi:DNA-binding phage protein